MKKFICLILSAIIIFGCVNVFANDVTITIDGDVLQTDDKPTIINSRTLVPLRAIFEGLGAYVTWDDTTKSVTAKKGYDTIVLQINSKVIFINQVRKEIDTAATLINDRTFVPLRAVSEALGATVTWEDAAKTAVIESQIPQKVIKDNYIAGEIKNNDNTVLLTYVCAFPQFANDTQKSQEHRENANKYVQYVLNEYKQKAEEDLKICKENGFEFIPHNLERLFAAKDTQTVEYKEITFNGSRTEEVIR